MTKSFMVALQLAGRRALVVGSGQEAAMRARNLAQAGAEVVVCCSHPDAEMQALEADGSVQLVRSPVTDELVESAFLTVLVDRNTELQERLGVQTRKLGRAFCAVDQPGHNSFHHVSIQQHGPVSIAISTDGKAPALAKRLREELERMLSEADLASFASQLGALRERMDKSERMRRLTQLVSNLRFSGRLELPDLPDEP